MNASLPRAESAAFENMRVPKMEKDSMGNLLQKSSFEEDGYLGELQDLTEQTESEDTPPLRVTEKLTRKRTLS